jgi:hypothetical protein
VLGPTTFPVRHWNDFVVVILEAWVEAIVRIVRAGSQRERVHFMEGPYAVEITSPSCGALRFRAVERDGHEKACVDAQTLPFADNLLAVSEQILSACRDRNCWSADADNLTAGLPALKKAAEKLRN